MEEARTQAIALLRNLSTEHGFVASSVERDNYYRVWGRDGVICTLAALVSGEDELITTARDTLETLSLTQDHTGRIVSNVSLDGSAISYGTTVGRIDATLWYVIGMMRYVSARSDEAFFENHKEHIKQALFYLECLELNGRGLVYIPQGGDWADEYIQEGYVLFDQLLYWAALTLYGSYTNNEYYSEKAQQLRAIIDVNYLPKEEHRESDLVYHKAIYDTMIESYDPPIPVASFGPHGALYHKDVFATSLFMLFGFSSTQECREIVDTIDNTCTGGDFPITPAFCPVIHEGEKQWEHLENNYLFRFKNKPFEFHNGGRWPLVHGFYLASGSHDTNAALEAFADTLARDDLSFPEFYHGRDHSPMGVTPLAMSAAGYLIAHHALVNNDYPFGTIV